MAKAAMQKLTDEIFSKMKSDPKSALEYFADDSKMLPPHHDAVCGKAELEKFHQMKKEKKPKGDYQMKFTVGDVIEAGDLAIVDGTTELSRDGKEIDQGKFLTVFKKVGGSYKILRSMVNSSKPLEGGS